MMWRRGRTEEAGKKLRVLWRSRPRAQTGLLIQETAFGFSGLRSVNRMVRATCSIRVSRSHAPPKKLFAKWSAGKPQKSRAKEAACGVRVRRSLNRRLRANLRTFSKDEFKNNVF